MLKKFKSYLLKHKLNISISVASIALVWLVWLIAYCAVANDYIVPSVADTFKSIVECLAVGEFWLALLNTFLRTLLSFAISFMSAVALVALGTAFTPLELFIKPIAAIIRTLPTLAAMLIILFWTTPAFAPVVVTSLVLFPMIYSQLTVAVNGIDRAIIQMAEVYKIGKRERLTKIYLPLIAPAVWGQAGADISLGIKIMISGEVLAHTYKSMGGLMQNAYFYVNIPRLAALTMLAVIVGLLIDLSFAGLERRIFKWR